MSEQIPEATPVEAPAAEAAPVAPAPAPPAASAPAPPVAAPAEEPAPEAAVAVPVDPDEVAMVSYNADGTPCQSEGFVVIGEDKTA